MKPPLKYRGGKTAELPHLLPHVPDNFTTYIEPFTGGGALFFALAPNRATLNDLNAPLMTFYRDLRNNYPALKRDVDKLKRLYDTGRETYETRKAQHPETKADDPREALYKQLRDMFNGKTPSPYTPGAVYYFINKTAYSGMIRYNKNGDYNVPYGRYKNLTTANLTEHHSRALQRATLTQGDFTTALHAARPGDFVFLDPPYDTTFSDYGNPETRDGFTPKDHQRLADTFKALPCKALMVIGGTPLTRELYDNYIADTYTKNYAVNIRNRFKASSEHLIVKNY